MNSNTVHPLEVLLVVAWLAAEALLTLVVGLVALVVCLAQPLAEHGAIGNGRGNGRSFDNVKATNGGNGSCQER